jgi:hypothetical protein
MLVVHQNCQNKTLGLCANRELMKLRSITIAVVLLLGLSTDSSRADNLKIGYGAFSMGYALIWITKEGRLFDKNGLDVDVLYLESNLVRTALISGDVPIGAMSGAAMAAPKLQGADLVVVLGFQNFLPFRLVVRPEIKSAADLKGKRVGVAGFGLLAERAARLVDSEARLESRQRCYPFANRRRVDPARRADQRIHRCDGFESADP